MLKTDEPERLSKRSFKEKIGMLKTTSLKKDIMFLPYKINESSQGRLEREGSIRMLLATSGITSPPIATSE